MMGQVLIVHLIGEISWWKNSGEEFTRIITEALSMGIRDLKLYLKSEGGDPVEAMEVYHQIKRMPGTKTCYIGALCASSATIPACACDTVVMSQYGLYMVHEPTVWAGGMTEEDLQSGISLLQGLKTNVTDMYMKRTGKTEEEVRKIMKATTWMTSAQALEHKWIDSIEEPEVIDSELFTLEPEMEATIPVQMKSNLISEIKMWKTKLMAALMLAGKQISPDATEEAYLAMVGDLVTDYNNLKTKLKDAESATMKAKAKMLVDNAVEQKKIVEADRAEYTELAESNFDLATKMLAKITPVMKITGKINEGGETDALKDKKFSERMTADVDGMLKMRAENPTEYKALYKAEYGSEPEL